MDPSVTRLDCRSGRSVVDVRRHSFGRQSICQQPIVEGVARKRQTARGAGRLASRGRMDTLNPCHSLCSPRGHPPKARQVRPSTRALLGEAAGIGESFRVDTLRQVFGLENDLADALGECLHQGLLSPSKPDTYRFSHAMIREIAYERLSPWHRIKVHTWRAQIDLPETPIRLPIRSGSRSIQLTMQVAGGKLCDAVSDYEGNCNPDFGSNRGVERSMPFTCPI